MFGSSSAFFEIIFPTMKSDSIVALKFLDLLIFDSVVSNPVMYYGTPRVSSSNRNCKS